MSFPTKTTANFLRGVRRRLVLPTAQRLLTDADILEVADTVIESELLPLLKFARQNFAVTHEDEALVSGQERYSLPVRAVDRGLKDLRWFSPDENSSRDLILVEPEDRHLFSQEAETPSGFYFEGDEIVLVPKPASDYGFIRKWYCLKPANLCTAGQAAEVAGISGDIISVSAVPNGYLPNTKVDFIRGRPGYGTLAMSREIANIAGTQLTFNTDVVPLSLAVGDYIAPAGLSPVLQIPDIAYRWVELKTAMDVAEIIEDFEASERIGKHLLSRAEKDLKAALEPRITGEATRIISRRGLLRSNAFRRFWR